MSKPPPPLSLRPATIQEALDRAVAALRAGRLEEVEQLAAGVVKSNPGHRLAGHLLGQALLMQGRPEAALVPLRRAARRCDDPVLETLLARARSETGQGQAALETLAAATGRRPAYPQAFLELGEQLGKLGRYDEAEAAFEAGLELAPDAHVLRVGLGHLLLARNARDRARALFAQVHAAAPERHDARVGLAHVLALDGDYAGAAGLYRQALALRPEEPALRIGLAKCLLEMGERAAGETVLRAAARGPSAAAGPAITALAATPRGRVFLRPSAAARFLGVAYGGQA